jgi:predicted nucleotidyltransferase component of viral defense system
MLSRAQLQRSAADGGYQIETYEKATLLLEVLDGIRAHPFVGSRLALKGGTALNLFLFDIPRLSVDIDLNYVGAADREAMLAERPRVEQALEQVFGRSGLTVKRMPTDHAGGKWRLSYQSALGPTGTLEVDVNFMLRTPLWPPAPIDSRPVGGRAALGVLVVERHELAAGKLAALVARSASRDLFDARELLRSPGLNPGLLRVAFVAYGGMNREDWRNVGLDRVTTTARDVDEQLVPMLRADIRPARAELAAWTNALVAETRELMKAVLPLRDREREFLELLNGKGVVAPELLTDNPTLQALLRTHPGLAWKALNVREHVRSGLGEP